MANRELEVPTLCKFNNPVITAKQIHLRVRDTVSPL